MNQKISDNLYCEFAYNDKRGFVATLRRRELDDFGRMYGYFDNVYHGFENMLTHWEVDCYICEPFTVDDNLLADIANFVVKNTKCKEPYAVQVNWVEWDKSNSKTFGKVFEDDV